MFLLKKAIEIAIGAHRGQKDRAGAPYILHPLRVMLRLESDTEMIVAILHDVIEDSSWTADQLREEGFSEEIVEAVENLTKRDGEPYGDFIERAKQSPLSHRVKIADLKDNMDMSRLSRLTEDDMTRFERYHRALQTLSRESTSGLRPVARP